MELFVYIGRSAVGYPPLKTDYTSASPTEYAVRYCKAGKCILFLSKKVLFSFSSGRVWESSYNPGELTTVVTCILTQDYKHCNLIR